jgi:polysaccharide pyruvyl transferase WcaK-like protein
MGSVGDEAIIHGMFHYFNGNSMEDYAVITYGDEFLNFSTSNTIGHINLGKYLFGGSWLIKLVAIWHIARFNRFYCMGTDVLDGYYSEERSCRRLELVKIAAYFRMPTSIIGFSFNNMNNQRCIDAFKRLPRTVRLCCRDPNSAARLAKDIEREVVCAGDTAFFLISDENSKHVKQFSDWADNCRKKGFLLMGVNINALHREYFHNKEASQLVERYSQIISSLRRNKKICFVFISHDNRWEINDYSLAEKIYQKLDKDIQRDCYFIPKVCNAAEIKAVCNHLDFVFTGRFHLAVACLGQGVPVAMVDYQGKVSGICEAFEIEDLIVGIEDLTSGERVFAILNILIENRRNIADKIRKRLPEMLEMVGRNFNDKEEALF